MRLHLCGVRGSTPAPGSAFARVGGHTSCIAIAHDDDWAPRLLIDAGTGLRRVCELLGDAPGELRLFRPGLAAPAAAAGGQCEHGARQREPRPSPPHGPNDR